MMYDKLPLIITAIAYIIVQAHAQDWGDTPGDPLDPSFVGDTMSTGMNLEMEQQAKDAGIITGNNPQYSSDSGPTTTYLGTPPAGAEIDVSPTTNTPTMNTAEVENVNATGTWSLDLLGEPTRHIDLSITQNKDAIMGYGAISGGNGTQRVTASGSLSGDKIVLTVMPINSLDLYKLELSIDPHTSGTYTAYSASGDTWSGDVTGTTPVGISSTASDALASNSSEVPGAGAGSPIQAGAASDAAAANSAADLGSGSASLGQGYSGSVSSSTSMSMDSSGGSSGMQSVSSVSSE